MNFLEEKHPGSVHKYVIQLKIVIQLVFPFSKSRALSAYLGFFCCQVSDLASEAKRERSALTKEVTKISNYGISV